MVCDNNDSNVLEQIELAGFPLLISTHRHPPTKIFTVAIDLYTKEDEASNLLLRKRSFCRKRREVGGRGEGSERLDIVKVSVCVCEREKFLSHAHLHVDHAYFY